jgi:YjjG family noncanonical pyrimidine nucleotidase
MNYSTLLLDLDHTLFDSDSSETSAFEEAMRVAGIDDAQLYAKAYQQINLNLWAKVERGELQPQQVRNLRFEHLVTAFGLAADSRLLADTFVAGLAANGELYAGARELVERLSGRVRLALVTNGLGEVQRARVERLGIGRYFDAIVISAEVGASKPNTAIFDFAFRELNCPPRESAVMVGDSLSSDILGGVNYGIATCWYNPKGKSAGPADRITHEIRELKDILRFTDSAVARSF